MKIKSAFTHFFRSIIITVSILSLAGCAASAITTFHQGQIALAHKNYPVAWDKFALASQDGLPDAYYGIGYMYYYGLYVQSNPIKAMYWFRRAARHHQPLAIAALNKIDRSGPSFGNLITGK